MTTITQPPARPSRPSVKLTALERPAMSKKTKNRYSQGIEITFPPKLTVVVRMPRLISRPPGNAIMGVMPQILTAARQNATEIVMSPAIF